MTAPMVLLRIKYWSKEAGYHVAGSSVHLLAQAAAVVLAVRYDTLSAAGLLTLAFALLAPLQFLAGMALSQLLMAGHPEFADGKKLIGARLLISAPLMLLAFLAGQAWGPSGLGTVIALLGIAKMCELVSEVLIAHFRSALTLHHIAVSRGALGISFAAMAVVLLHTKAFTGSFTYAITLAYALASAIGMAIDLIIGRRWLASFPRPNVRVLCTFVRANIVRGAANSLNSCGTNLPRYLLQMVTATDVQAAYSLVASVSRMLTRLVQPLVFPTLARLRTALEEREQRWVAKYNWCVFLGCCAVGGLLTAAWWSLHELDLLRAFSPDFAATLSIGQGQLILLATTVYFMRFLYWHQAMIGLDQGIQLRIAGAGVAGMLASGVLLIPRWGIGGAAIADIAVNAVTVMAVLMFTSTRSARVPA